MTSGDLVKSRINKLTITSIKTFITTLNTTNKQLCCEYDYSKYGIYNNSKWFKINLFDNYKMELCK